MVQAMMSAPKSCVVCSVTDARGLSTTRLSTGELVVVCGLHELMHKRSSRTAATVAELRSLTHERRRSVDRRDRQIDELGALLSDAFAEDKRASGDRRG